jgi:nucleotide-binding universal stress UspA family protein
MTTVAGKPKAIGSHSLIDQPCTGRGPGRATERSINPASFKEVLACLDFSELGSGVAPHAHLVARALGARLTLLHVLEPDTVAGGAPPDPLDWGIREREARVYLEGLTRLLGDLESGIRSELIQGRAADQIINWAEQHKVDLTVICSHGACGVTDWDLASTARKLVDRTPGSVLLVPAAVAARQEEVRYRRILVPLDGSPRAESVVPIAVRIAAAQKAELIFAHMVSVPEIIRGGPLDVEGADLKRRVVQHNHRVASAYLHRLRARVSRAGSRVRTLVVGDGATRPKLETLIREERVDLVVMSAHGHTGRTDSPYGSFTEYSLTHATTPVLVVRDRARRRMGRAGLSSTQPGERFTPTGESRV